MRNVIEKIKIVVVLLILISSFCLVGFVECHYEKQGFIYKIENEEVHFIDERGEEWIITSDIPYVIGEDVKIIFYTNGTDSNIYDDEVYYVKKLKK